MLQILVLFLIPGLFGDADGYFLRVCEGGHLSINCGSKVTNIKSASYGRTRKGVCAPRGYDSNTFCYSASSMRVTLHRCQGQHRCTVHATNSVFGDPCVGTAKYLEVSYNCVSKRPHHSTLLQVCEGGVHEIRCKPWKKIKVLSANYGRLTGGHVCGGRPIKTTHCGAAGALSKVQADCQGRWRCVLHAVNAKFGDPCYGTYKYLEVRYRCKN